MRRLGFALGIMLISGSAWAGPTCTTEPKAKELGRLAEHLITLAKRGDLHARRQIIAQLYDVQIANKLVDELAPRFADRPGGYVRLTHLGPRRGDSAPMAQLELVL